MRWNDPLSFFVPLFVPKETQSVATEYRASRLIARYDDDTVIAGWCEHALCTSLSLGTTSIVDGRTQCMPLSVGGEQRTPFWDDGAPVFLPSARRQSGKAAGRDTAPRDQAVEIRMETSALHAYFALGSYSSRR